PGIGAQGGSLEEVAENGLNKQCGLIINSSRGIVFSSQGKNFAEKAGEKAKEIQQQMEKILANNNLI
ncbi:MAG: orotidine 5'-phosphate decarboxylase, partial [Bacteroidales bacterium]|nr:orotidine 5'-phosphate decarboxylase [Bacteroidales bacterium]